MDVDAGRLVVAIAHNVVLQSRERRVFESRGREGGVVVLLCCDECRWVEMTRLVRRMITRAGG